MRLLVAGGTGFLGRPVIERAVAAGFDVVGMARTPQAASRVESLGAGVVLADLTKPSTLDNAFATVGPDALLNISSLGIGHVDALIAAALSSKVVRGVFISTATIYSRFEIAGKDVHIAAERSIMDSAMEWTILRPTMIYGGLGDRNMVQLLRFLDRTRVVPIPGTGRCLHQPIHVDDLASLVLTALTSTAALRKAYDVAGPEPIELRHIVGQAAAAMGRRVLILPIPLAPTVYAARLYGRLSKAPRIRVDQVQRLGENKAVSIAAATADLAFTPNSFRDGIAREASELRRLQGCWRTSVRRT